MDVTSFSTTPAICTLHIAHSCFRVLFSWCCRVDSLFCCGCPESWWTRRLHFSNGERNQERATGCFMRKKDKFAQIPMKFVRNLYEFRTNFTQTSLFTQWPSTFVRTKFVPISYEFHANPTKFSHLVHGDRTILRDNPPHFHRVSSTHKGPWRRGSAQRAVPFGSRSHATEAPTRPPANC